MFTREDWTLFRNLGTLSQKAGVPVAHLRRLVVKELVDNALDAGAKVEFGREGTHTYWVEDDGPGIPGTAEDVARLFSIKRPLTSTKIVRLPVRGALGNGLRVVVGAVLASGGSLIVTTRGERYTLQPLDDGTTKIVKQQSVSGSSGTRITITLPEGVPSDPADMVHARLAKAFSFAKRYEGKTSAYWYDSDSFYELLQSAEDRPLADVLSHFEGFEGMELNDACNQISRAKSENVLTIMRKHSKPVSPTKIGLVGNPEKLAYAKTDGVLIVAPGRGSLNAELPYVVEAWAQSQDDQDDDDTLIAFVNGTPIVGEMRTRRDGVTKLAIFGCGLRHLVEKVSKRKAIIRLNITIPYMPITTDGKEPDFARLLGPIQTVISKATKKLKTIIRRQEQPETQKALVLEYMRDGILHASGNNRYRFAIRQLYYSIRKMLADDGKLAELNWNGFCRTITDYEADRGEIRNMYRDPRGNLYHPHLRTSIPLGTLAVEQYDRPAWTFNKILYCEKEGFTNLLIADGWPERNDCALLSSKGFASRAVRDVLDLLGETDEELLFFCIHDADSSGTLIYQALQEETRARAARKVKIINLGLEPWEAMRMGLQVEEFQRKGSKRSPVARYVNIYTRDEEVSDMDWGEWLQRRRVELNSMTSPQFIQWLDKKMSEYGKGKVIPPEHVLNHRLKQETEAMIRSRETARILAEAGIDGIVHRRMSELASRLDKVDVTSEVKSSLMVDATERWSDPVRELANDLLDNHK